MFRISRFGFKPKVGYHYGPMEPWKKIPRKNPWSSAVSALRVNSSFHSVCLFIIYLNQLYWLYFPKYKHSISLTVHFFHSFSICLVWGPAVCPFLHIWTPILVWKMLTLNISDRRSTATLNLVSYGIIYAVPLLQKTNKAAGRRRRAEIFLCFFPVDFMWCLYLIYKLQHY